MNFDDFYKRADGLLRQYETFTQKQQRELDEMRASERYSRQFLNDQSEKAASARQHEREVIAQRLDALKSEYSAFLDEKFDLESSSISPSLVNLLSSGISFEPGDWSALARNHSGSLVESRLLRDCALKQGFQLDCYTDREKYLDAFSEHCRRLGMSTEDDKFGRFYPDSNFAQADGLGTLNSLLVHSYSCEKIAIGTDVAVGREIAKQRQEAETALNDRAFLEGLNGQPVPDPQPADTLTAAEKEAAEIAAGPNGPITPKIAEAAQKAVMDYLNKSRDGSVQDPTEATEQP